ncbi:hypothetical protein CC78DRAFT_575949 [Lojkania enalia]|uniref:Uncharacterized protein n=1 Tax=Lojkania enalia TaxID=147567 RepID=A0A9P4KJL0_9PLEO|nr:hypothetical protein CC78DRAFT_575949 [Didymosphaeria enalia]
MDTVEVSSSLRMRRPAIAEVRSTPGMRFRRSSSLTESGYPRDGYERFEAIAENEDDDGDGQTLDGLGWNGNAQFRQALAAGRAKGAEKAKSAAPVMGWIPGKRRWRQRGCWGRLKPTQAAPKRQLGALWQAVDPLQPSSTQTKTSNPEITERGTRGGGRAATASYNRTAAQRYDAVPCPAD